MFLDIERTSRSFLKGQEWQIFVSLAFPLSFLKLGKGLCPTHQLKFSRLKGVGERANHARREKSDAMEKDHVALVK